MKGTARHGAPDWLARLAATPVRPVFWFESPAEGVSIAAVGAAAEIRCSGRDRFAHGAEAVSAALREVESEGGAPLAVGGFGFADDDSADRVWRELPALRFFVPRLFWCRDRDGERLVRAWSPGTRDETLRLQAGVLEPAPAVVAGLPALDPVADPAARERWRERVERARAQVHAGALAKIVLSRPRTLRADGPIDVPALVAALREARPSCTGFWLGVGATSFVGSTPELLVRRRGLDVLSGALAGSAPRGATPAADAALGEGLRRCPKNAVEHRLVVEAVREVLASRLERIEAPEAPALLRVPEAQHLHTPIGGRLREAEAVLSLAGVLHPTPAVCGVPRERARRWIEREESDRGWYTGAVGWTDADGNGSIVVALRSALVERDAIRLRAGAGIVSASDPDAEFDETEAKLGALFRDPGRERRGRAA